MGGFLRAVRRLTTALLLAGAGGLALAWFLASRSLPDYGGRRIAPELSAEVEILRDSRAMPHIFAASEHDAFYALGYAHAQDRLWRMILARKTAQGRLAEIFGPSAFRLDEYLRALNLTGRAEASLSALNPATRRILDSYAAGVNLRLAEARTGLGRGAPEFWVYSDPLEDWRPADSVALLKLFALGASGAQAEELRRALLLNRLPPERALLVFEAEGAADLSPPPPEMGPPPPPPGPPARRSPSPIPDRDAERLAPHVGLAALASPGAAGASNVWAVSGARTAARTPILANDPHLPLTAPTQWHMARLQAPGLRVMGATLPGIPAVIFGRTARVAWGGAALGADDQDLFIERIAPGDGSAYLTPEGAQAFLERREILKARGAPSREATIRETRHGPVLPLELFDLAAITPEGHVPALAWTGLAEDDTTLDAFLGLNRAQTLEDALRASEKIVAPALALAVADEGGVAMTAAGRAPLRPEASRTRGYLPAMGWTEEGDWLGWMEPEDLPRVVRPPEGRVAAANAKIGSEAYPRHISFDWDAPWRLARIERLLERDPQTAAGFRQIQNDVGSDMAIAVSPVIPGPLWKAESEGAPPTDPRRRRRLEALKRLMLDWNGEMRAEAAEPLIFTAWLDVLTSRLLKQGLGDAAARLPGARPEFLLRVFEAGPVGEAWCAAAGSSSARGCQDLAGEALDEALDRLSETWGPDISAWRWGRAHPAIHQHDPLGERRLLGLDLGWIFDIVHESGGDDYTINRGLMRWTGPQPYANRHSGGYRAIYDFADLDRSVYALSTGQSGHFLSRFYADFSLLWRAGDYATLSMLREDAEAGAVGVMRLTPP
ncbi:penicillin acylase family protein [Neomegalonema perideroedes]|uniref:penicillin acylase family protein n=1 Tax=Neomegalonema perideroedes TaxID=217219 RepID=UPI0003A8D22E|nr:penicillin acylase family protein [Neomegalonema perideroedes]